MVYFKLFFACSWIIHLKWFSLFYLIDFCIFLGFPNYPILQWFLGYRSNNKSFGYLLVFIINLCTLMLDKLHWSVLLYIVKYVWLWSLSAWNLPRECFYFYFYSLYIKLYVSFFVNIKLCLIQTLLLLKLINK